MPAGDGRDGKDRTDGKWVRRDSGPVVRPYAVTGGRTEPADGEVLDLIAVVVAVGLAGGATDDPIRLTPEHRKILRLCERPMTVADIASDTAVRVVRNRPAVQLPGNDVLKEILNGLRAL